MQGLSVRVRLRPVPERGDRMTPDQVSTKGLKHKCDPLDALIAAVHEDHSRHDRQFMSAKTGLVTLPPEEDLAYCGYEACALAARLES
jgi:hypothetical protein